MRMEMYKMKMQNGVTSQNIANFMHDLNKNGVGFSILVVILGLFASVLAYLFAFGLLGVRLM
jgi:hypothetical protein